ncbi:carbohydrate binding domain-containing protein [Paenibacillus agaridevorans]|uniref:carbohydrate binding domain-containing protein n=1 Tax=Paenibacillus agaridevorans TaxID=171404 RepID=UPI001BE43011|nr:carbohydrate binding domain-containing protein [Paenibacillus agaridevorans]
MTGTTVKRKTIVGSFRDISILTGLLVVLVIGNLIGASRAQAQNIGDNVMSNGGFEQLGLGNPLNWDAMAGWGNPEITLSTSEVYAGLNSVAIQTQQNTKPWIVQTIPYEAGATYEISAWLKGVSVQGAGVGFKLEYYKGNEIISENHLLEYDTIHSILSDSVTGDWQRISIQDVAPLEAGLVKVYLRLYGTGTVYFDNAAFELLKHRPMIELATDQYFYYSHVTEGQVRASFFSAEEPLEDLHAEARIYRQSTGVTIATYSQASAGQPLNFGFNPSQMAKDEPYRVEVKLLDSLNTVLETAQSTIYRHDPPEMLREDGTLLVDEEPFFPIAAYHVFQTDYPYVAEVGVNTVQGRVTNNADVLEDVLDDADLNGLKVMVPLYYNMQVGENEAMTTEFVTRFKDHPAVLAWMIMDEPIYNGKTSEELINAYLTIRSIDKKHPVYMVEAPYATYDITAKSTDIFATDYYPLPDQPISLVGEHTALAKQMAGENKPVWTVLQAMYNPPTRPYLPTIEEVRNMAYQSFINGSQGIAYYSINEAGWQLRYSPLWLGLMDFKEELDVIGRLVVDADRISEGQSGDVQWSMWEDGDERYVMVVNVSDETQQATVPLGVTGYHAELLFGDSRPSIDEFDDELILTMEPEQALLYRIVPFQTSVDQAIVAGNAASALSSHSHWIAKMSALDSRLTSIEDELEEVSPSLTDAAKDTLKALRILGDLNDWVHASAVNPEKQEMLNALDQMKKLLGPIAGTYALADLELGENHIFGQGELNELQVSLTNQAPSSAENINVNLLLPEAFNVAPISQSLQQIGSGLSDSMAFSFQIASSIERGRYPIRLEIEFEYKGAPVTIMKSIAYSYTDLLRAAAEPAVISTNKGGAYSFALDMTSNASRNLPITLNNGPLPSGITMQLPQPFTLPAQEQATVTGSVYLPMEITEGVYETSIGIQTGGYTVQEVPLTIVVDYNLLHNPGFEQATEVGSSPEGWIMRQGSWVQDAVHSGQYAVALNPDPNSNYNVINSSGLMPVTPGARYKLSGWVKNDSTTGEVRIGLRQIRENQTSTIGYTWKTVDDDSDWTYYELELRAASQASYVQVYLESGNAANGTAWFDDFYVEEFIDRVQVEAVPASITTNKGGTYSFAISVTNTDSEDKQIALSPGLLPAGMTLQLPGVFTLAGNGQMTVTGSVYLPAEVPEGQYLATILVSDGNTVQTVPLQINVNYNMLHNPGFEQGTGAGTAPDGWLMRQGSWVQNTVHSGQYAIALLPDSQNVYNVVNSLGFIPVQAGAKYVLSGWVKNDSTTGEVKFGFRQIRENRTSTLTYNWQEVSSDTDWTYYELEITPGANAHYLQVYFQANQLTDGTAWFDDWYVEEIILP